MPSAPSTPEGHPDGRVARGERTRRNILDAHAQLLQEGVLRPTAAAIAARAGVSVRSLWANFKDREALVAAATSMWVGADDTLDDAIDPDLPRDERVARFCRQRALRLEALAPASRSSALDPASPAIRRGRGIIIARLEGVVRTLFASELAEAGAAAQEVVASIVVSASARGWLVLRDDLRLDVSAAEAVMRRSVGTVLGEPFPTSGS